MLEFADISRPFILQKNPDCLLVHLPDIPPEFPVIFLNKETYHRRNIFQPLPQRRDIDIYNPKPVKQILAQIIRSNRLIRRYIDIGKYAYVNRNLL